MSGDEFWKNVKKLWSPDLASHVKTQKEIVERAEATLGPPRELTPQARASLRAFRHGLYKPIPTYDEGFNAGLEVAARLAQEHDSALARLGGGHYESDRRILKNRGEELAEEILKLKKP